MDVELCRRIRKYLDKREGAWKPYHYKNASGVDMFQFQHQYVFQPMDPVLYQDIQDAVREIVPEMDEYEYIEQHCNKYVAGDYMGRHLDNSPVMNKIKTLVVQLSEPHEYEGGRLTIEDPNLHLDIAQGSHVVFPSLTWHEVSKITQGTRIILLFWFCNRIPK